MTSFFQDLFPYLTTLLKSNLPFLAFITEITCPEQKILFLRNPALLPIQLTLFIFSLRAFERFYHQKKKVLADGFLFFAYMNLTSIFAHSIYEKNTFGWHLFLQLDVGFTAASCVSLIINCIYPQCVYSRKIGYMLLFICSVFHRVPFLNEFMYLGLLVAAALVQATCHVSELSLSRNIRKLGAFFIGISGLAIAASALFVNGALCQVSSNYFNYVHLVFLGCGISFLGLFFYNIDNEKAKLN